MYRTTSFGSVIARILGLRGFSVATYLPLMDVKERYQFSDAANSACRDVWTDKFWPDIMRFEQRTFRPAWDSTKNYLAGFEVYRFGTPAGCSNQISGQHHYYVAVQDGAGHDPLTDATGTYWVLAGAKGFSKYIEFAQPWEPSEIDGVEYPMCCTNDDPRMQTEMRWIEGCVPLFDTPGILLPSSSPASKPWVRFRPLPPKFSAVNWDSTRNYSVGDTCYLEPQSYVATQPNQNQNPGTATDSWQVVGVPEMFEDYIALGAVAILVGGGMGDYRQTPAVAGELDRLHRRYLDRMGIAAQTVWQSGGGRCYGRGRGRMA